MSLVLDSSMTLAWCFEDERVPRVLAILDKVREDGAIVPPLWRYEVANGLLMALRRKRLDTNRLAAMLKAIGEFAIVEDEVSASQLWQSTLRLADRNGLTVYDAAYLELAERRALPLATLDADLARAAEAAGVAVM